MSLRSGVYIDTSVISAHGDPREPRRMLVTRASWSGLCAHRAHISPVVLEEIEDNPDSTRRDEMLALVRPLTVVSWTSAMEELTRLYLSERVFAEGLKNDARHVAACTVSDLVLVSWNFRHLVNRTRRVRVNVANLAAGYNQIEILSPPELR